jgi:hypothetical protein
MHIEQLPGLQKPIGVFGRASHGHRELHLPRGEAALQQQVQHAIELGEAQAVHLGVHRDGDARRRQMVDRGHGGVEASRQGALRVVRGTDAVERDRYAVDPCVPGHARALGGDAAATGRHRAEHPRASYGGGDDVPVVAQVRLAADERHLSGAHLRELVDQRERLLGAQLSGTRAPRARSAVPACEIAAERQLPHDEDETALVGDVRASAHRVERGAPVGTAAGMSGVPFAGPAAPASSPPPGGGGGGTIGGP